MSECINLRERFGAAYRIGYDPAVHPSTPAGKVDPWMILIPCRPKGSNIYPYGGTKLIIEIEGHAKLRNQLRCLSCCELIQDGDTFTAFRFDVADFDAVAALVKPRKVRRLSDKHRAAAVERLRKHQFSANPPQSRADFATEDRRQQADASNRPGSSREAA